MSVGMFEVSREGLRKLVRRRGLAFVIHELAQNAWDSCATRVSIRLEPIAGQAACTLVVEDDDPEGFRDFSHAWTFFAESEKKSDVQKRGRFNIGEKLVIAACDWAEIHTTKGKVCFDGDERSEFMRPCDRREGGTVFTGKIRMTRYELREVEAAVGKKWFDQGPSEAVNDLLIHELSHEFGSHLTDEFDHALSRLGAKMVALALAEPGFFRKFEREGAHGAS